MDYEGPIGPARSTQASPARPSTAQISPEMDRWTMEDQGRPGSPTQATVLAQLECAVAYSMSGSFENVQ